MCLNTKTFLPKLEKGHLLLNMISPQYQNGIQKQRWIPKKLPLYKLTRFSYNISYQISEDIEPFGGCTLGAVHK